MRILSVGNMYPPHHFGGYELVWRSAVEHLRSRGHEVRVLTTDIDTGATEADGPDVYRELRSYFRDGRFQRYGLLGNRALTRHNHRILQGHLASLRPEVVTWWSMGGLTLTMLETVWRQDLPAVAFVHDEWLDYGRWADDWSRTFAGPRRGRMAPLGEMFAGVPATIEFDRAATYVFVSEYVRRQAFDLNLGLQRTAVAHSGIHSEFLAPTKPPPWRWNLLYVGRLDPRKGVDIAVRALIDLPAQARLMIAGGWDTAEEERLRTIAEEAGVGGSIEFLGQCDRAELIELYDAADVVVFPVRWNEPWGLVPMEGMAKGRPVVATGRGGSGEYLRDGENCLIFDPEKPGDLAAAVRRLASDDDLRRRLRSNGIATAERHTELGFNAAVEAAVVEASRGASAPVV